MNTLRATFGARGRALILVCLVIMVVLQPYGAASQEGRDQSRAARTEESQQNDAKVQPKEPPGAAPEFRSVEPTVSAAAVRSSTFRKALQDWVRRVLPNQGGVLWLAIIISALVAADFSRPFSRRNVDLILITLPAVLLIDIERLSAAGKDPVKFALARMIFLGLFILTAALFARALTGGIYRTEKTWTPNLPSATLIALFVALLACNVFLLLVHFPDDCGIYTNLGTKRMLETNKFPYGDPMLRGGAAATYGPVLYLAHIPFQLALRGVVPDTVEHGIVWPPLLATKLTTLAFHVLGIVALLVIGRRMGNPAVGWGLVCLYIGSAYVMGLGGEHFYITGLTFISHIAPAALTLVAFACLERPLWAGAVLAVAAGTLFYPAFMFPLWFGYYFWRGKGWIRFAGAFAVVCIAIFGLVMLRTDAGPNESVIHVLHESTVGHQESSNAYGSSTFGFWGTHPRLAAFWQKPLHPNWYLLKPAVLLFAAFLTATFFLARNRTLSQLAFLTAAVALAVQLWKTHAGGTYVEWYLPFLLIGVYGARTSPAEPALQAPEVTAKPELLTAEKA